ncbi:non-ribosomal peptide synthetase [Streptomyces sp. NPDC127079]|uniref:non-ribosomal peptide synthetase n=1 Tax=Streptomyces sp. NPDC127079 TaxID=3347132 RepID=UPI0036497BAD
MVEGSQKRPKERVTSCLHEQFRKHAEMNPGAIAVVHGEDSVTYGELHSSSSFLATRLRELGVGPDVVVGLHVERSVAMVAGMLGILEAGGAYLPLRTDDPVERVSTILREAGVDVVLTSAATDGRLAAFGGTRVRADAAPVVPESDATGPQERPTPENLAYVIYTSGTTGTPKGVAVPHRAAARIVRSGIYGDFDAEQTFLQACPLSFDASVLEVWGALANGGRLVLLPDQRVSAEAVIDAVRRHRVTTLWLTPTLFNQIVDDGLLAGTGLRQVVIGGEVVSTPHLAKAMHTTDIRFSNGYGPTEAGVFTCCKVFEEADLAYSPPPVGPPLPGTRVWILDEQLQPVPDGELGELYIGGDALAHGYHRRPDLTEQAFLPSPFEDDAEARVYRSGDLARALPGGLIQILGRLDSQVKIRGNRVELAEVESALLEAPEVLQAAVVDRQEGAERVLVAYLIPAEGTSPTITDLRHRLAKSLPEYMIPSKLYSLDRLPTNGNGKTDRNALRAGVPAEELPLGVAFVPAVSELEKIIGEIWSGILKAPSIGIDDNYFDLGGTSLSIKQAQKQLQERLGIRLPSTALYEYPTVRYLAQAIKNSEV